MKPLLTLLLLVCPLAAQQWRPNTTEPRRFERIGISPTAPAPAHANLYGASVAALIGAHAADLASSWGRPEVNPLLSPGAAGGRFGWQAATIKLSLAAGSLVIQRFVLRRRPDLQKTFALSNFIAAGAMGGVAIRNQAAGAPRIR